jgi:hypothetical protein
VLVAIAAAKPVILLETVQLRARPLLQLYAVAVAASVEAMLVLGMVSQPIAPRLATSVADPTTMHVIAKYVQRQQELILC